jgi:hypothetical protein
MLLYLHLSQSYVYYIFGGLECVCHSFAYVAHFLFLRDVWIRTQRAAVASRCATNLATQLIHTHITLHTVINSMYVIKTSLQDVLTYIKYIYIMDIVRFPLSYPLHIRHREIIHRRQSGVNVTIFPHKCL